MAQEAELSTKTGVRQRFDIRNPVMNRVERQCSPNDYETEDQSPREIRTEQCPKRDAEEVREGHPGYHDSYRF